MATERKNTGNDILSKRILNDIIRERYPFEPTKKIADDLGLSESSVYNRAFAMGIKKDPVYLRTTQYPPGYLGGKATQFQKGQVPPNKGEKMSKDLYEKVAKTMFKKGNKPMNTQPIGTIHQRKDTGGKMYQYIKLADSKWQLLNRYTWEQHNGPIPKGMVVVYKDGNYMNNDITNLLMITLKENMARNTIQRLPKELQQVMRLKCKLIKKINNNGTKQTK
jgi:hypothetical protein